MKRVGKGFVLILFAAIWGAPYPSIAAQQDPGWMDAKLEEPADDVAGQLKWRDGDRVVVNGRAFRVRLAGRDRIILEAVSPRPSQPASVAHRVASQLGATPVEIREANARKITPSLLFGWGLVSSANTGILDGDGFWDGTVKDRARAMTLARADATRTRWEYGLDLLKQQAKDWGFAPEEYPGQIVFDVETWNECLFSRRHLNKVPAGVMYDPEAGTVRIGLRELQRLDPERASSSWSSFLRAHPFAVDSDRNGSLDSIAFTRDDVVAAKIRLAKKLRAQFPEAQLSWFAFPAIGYWGSDETALHDAAAWEDGLLQLARNGAIDFLAPSVYDHYSHVYRLAGETDAGFLREQQVAHARDRASFEREVRTALKIARKLELPVWLYTWHMYHNDGDCARSGHLVVDAEWRDHVQYLASLTEGEQGVAGIILWGADAYYWRQAPCYRANMEKYVGVTEERFQEFQRSFIPFQLDRAIDVARSVWSEKPHP